MNFNKSTMGIVNQVIGLVQESTNVDLSQYVNDHLEEITNLLQVVYDFDLEPMVHTTLFTLYNVCPPEVESHVVEWKEFIFTSLVESEGDLQVYFSQGVQPQEETTDDLIPDEIYGEVDPEMVEHLKTCYSL